MSVVKCVRRIRPPLIHRGFIPRTICSLRIRVIIYATRVGCTGDHLRVCRQRSVICEEGSAGTTLDTLARRCEGWLADCFTATLFARSYGNARNKVHGVNDSRG